MAMIAFLADLARFFARDGLTVDDVVHAVGPIDRDPGVPLPITLQPSADGIHAASLARYPDSRLPYLLTLELAESARPTVGELTRAFGPFVPLPRDRGMPAWIRFAPAAPPSRWTVAINAAVAGSTTPSDGDEISIVVLQREPVDASADAPSPETRA
jgi:hypothetical protein